VRRRDPLYILILYGLSFTISLAGFACALSGYVITVTAAFDERSRKGHRADYEENFFNMQSIGILVLVNEFPSITD
jgi:hypothetical protein